MLSEVHRRVEPVEILAHFYLAARVPSTAREFIIMPHAWSFVNSNFAQNNRLGLPKICAKLSIAFFMWIWYYNIVKRERVNCID